MCIRDRTMNLPASCVQVINLPSTYTLTVETERLMNVTLCGPAGSLEALNLSLIHILHPAGG